MSYPQPSKHRPAPTALRLRAARPLLAFTLVELLLVMALLVVVLSVTAPTLARFFRGRTLDTEASRLLALTRYGQSRAVSTGIPMILWVKPKDGTYGLREDTAFNPGQLQAQAPTRTGREERNLYDEEPVRYYELGKDLRFELARSERLTNGVATIQFEPDGAIDEMSVQEIMICDREEDFIPIIQSRNGLKYEIGDKTNPQLRSLR